MNKPKKNCNGCKALRGIGLEQECQLNYKISIEKKETDDPKTKVQIAIPLEICPKPRTYAQLYNNYRL